MNRNLTADGVRNLLVADFWNHASAGDGFFNHLRAPFAAADRSSRALNTDFLCAAGIAGIYNALLYNRAWNMSSFGDPFAAAFLNRVAFSDWLADGVAHVLIAGFCFRAARCAAHVPVAGLINRLADVVANSAVAGLVHWLADRVALFAVAGLINRLTDMARHFAIAGLVHRLADVACHRSVTGLIHRLANRVAFVAITGLVDIPGAGNRHRFGALVIDRLHARVLLCFPHGFLNSVTLRTASAPSSDEITTWRTRRSSTSTITARFEQSRFRNSAVQQHGDCNRGSQHEPFHCLYLDSSEERDISARQAHFPAYSSTTSIARLDSQRPVWASTWTL